MVVPFLIGDNRSGINLNHVIRWLNYYSPELGDGVEIWLTGNTTAKGDIILIESPMREFYAVLRAIAQMQSDERGRDAVTGSAQE